MPNSSNITPGFNLEDYSRTQIHFLGRLVYLQHQRNSLAGNAVETGSWRMRLVNKALYSTYRDCVDLGVGEEAKLYMARSIPERPTGRKE